MSPEAINKAIELATGGIRNGVTDLNAMHEAEKALPIRRRCLYRDNLINVTFRDCQSTFNPWWNATAAQRAEAFLRTIGKWEEK